MRKNSIKNIRINTEVRKEMSRIIREELKDPRIHPMTSVMEVEVAPDLKTCKAYISVLGSHEEAAETLAGLKQAEGFIRRQLAHTVNLRNTPEIRFILDQSTEYGVAMSHLIDEIAAKEGRISETAENSDGEKAAEAAAESEDSGEDAFCAGQPDGAENE